VRLLEPGGERDLALKALRAQLHGERRADDLHHHVAREALVASQEHPRHRPAAEFALDRVGSTE
jgi:hypothetical protein